MSEIAVITSQIVDGTWVAKIQLVAGRELPKFEIAYQGKPIGTPRVARGEGEIATLEFDLSAKFLTDGIHTFSIAESGSDAVLASTQICAGEVEKLDFRAELDLMRQELELTKRVLRRHLANDH